MVTFERVLFHQSTSGFPDGFRAVGGRFWWPQKAATKILGLGFVDSLLGSLVLVWAFLGLGFVTGRNAPLLVTEAWF